MRSSSGGLDLTLCSEAYSEIYQVDNPAFKKLAWQTIYLNHGRQSFLPAFT